MEGAGSIGLRVGGSPVLQIALQGVPDISEAAGPAQPAQDDALDVPTLWDAVASFADENAAPMGTANPFLGFPPPEPDRYILFDGTRGVIIPPAVIPVVKAPRDETHPVIHPVRLDTGEVLTPPFSLIRLGSEASLAFTLSDGTQVAGVTHIGSGQQDNEDAMAVAFAADGRRFHVIADGRGGSEDGWLAAHCYVGKVAAELSKGKTLDEAIATAAAFLKRRIAACGYGDKVPPDALPATTLLVTEFKPSVRGPGTARSCVVGDPRALYFERTTRHGRLREIARTLDQSQAQDLRAASAVLVTTSRPRGQTATRALRDAYQDVQQYALAGLAAYVKHGGARAHYESLLVALAGCRRFHGGVTLHPVQDRGLIAALRAAGILVLTDQDQKRHPRANRITWQAGANGIAFNGKIGIPNRTDTVRLKTGMFIVEGCDALSMFTPEEIAAIIQDCRTATQARDKLLATALQRMAARQAVIARIATLKREIHRLTALNDPDDQALTAERVGLIARHDADDARLDNITILVTLVP